MRQRQRMRSGGAAYLLVMLLGACATAQAPPPLREGPIRYLDLPSFDAQVSQALSANPASVRIVFYDKIRPSLLPERIKPLMGAVQSGGGEVRVVLPPSELPPSGESPSQGELQPRGFPLLSLLPGLWTFLKEMSGDQSLKAIVKGFDAEIMLKRDGSGDHFVEAVVLVRR